MNISLVQCISSNTWFFGFLPPNTMPPNAISITPAIFAARDHDQHTNRCIGHSASRHVGTTHIQHCLHCGLSAGNVCTWVLDTDVLCCVLWLCCVVSKNALVNGVVRSRGVLITAYSTALIHQDLLLSRDWHYVILDEGHKIRNPDAQITLVCKQVWLSLPSASEYTPWAIKKRAPFIFSITLANIDGFS